MRRAILGTAGILAALLALAAMPAHAQDPLWDPGLVTPQDSADLVDAGRKDQAAFERIRRNQLGYTWGGGSSRCDERIGRFCLNHMGGGDDWTVPEEPEEVLEARADLVLGLRMAAEIIPGDHWIVGQRVRYLVEAREFDEADAAVRQCRAETWWCAALAGYTFHYSGRPAEADSAFRVALDSMDADQRERWTDLSLILDERSVRLYRRLEDDDRAAFEDRFWRLADPLLIRPGNELHAEHLSRHVWAEMQERAETVERLSWGWDLREILIRYGWPVGWEQTRNFGMTSGPPPLVSHYSSAPRRLLPPPEALFDSTATSGEWDVEEEKTRAGYNIPLPDTIARWFAPLAHQVAIFPRGETARIAAAFELPRDSLPADVDVDASLTLLPARDPSLAVLTHTAESRQPFGAMVMEAPAIPLVVGIEVLVPAEKRIARARYGVDLSPIPPGLISLSDLLLLRGDTELPESLEEAVPLARGSARVVPGERIGIYWETYGIDPGEYDLLTMSLRLLQPRVGWLRRLGQRTGLLRDSDAIRLRWEEPVTTGPLLPRSVHVEVPPVKPGVYAIELSVEVPGREGLTVRREIQVGDR